MTTWKSVSVVTSAEPARVWAVYRTLRWQEWDHDIESMVPLGTPGEPNPLAEGKKISITMRDGKTHTARLYDVHEERAFSYTAPLPGCELVATHTLEALGPAGVGSGGGGTRITHTFEFRGLLGGLFRWLTSSYVQCGLDTNTAALKVLAESAPL